MDMETGTPCPQSLVKQLKETLSRISNKDYPIREIVGDSMGGILTFTEATELGKPILIMPRLDILVLDMDSPIEQDIQLLSGYCKGGSSEYPLFICYSGGKSPIGIKHMHAYLSIFNGSMRELAKSFLKAQGFQVRHQVYSRPPLSPYWKGGDVGFVPTPISGFNLIDLKKVLYNDDTYYAKHGLKHNVKWEELTDEKKLPKAPRHLPTKYKLLNQKKHPKGTRSEKLFSFVMAALHAGWNEGLIRTEISNGTLNEKLLEIELKEKNLWVGRKKRDHYIRRMIETAREKIESTDSSEWREAQKAEAGHALGLCSVAFDGHRVEHVVLEWMLLRSMDWSRSYIRASVREIAIETCTQIGSVSRALKILRDKEYITPYRVRGPLSFEYQINRNKIIEDLSNFKSSDGSRWLAYVGGLTREDYALFNNTFRRSVHGTRGLGMRVRQCVKAAIQQDWPKVSEERLRKDCHLSLRQSRRVMQLMNESGLMDSDGVFSGDLLYYGEETGLALARESLKVNYEAQKLSWKSKYKNKAHSLGSTFVKKREPKAIKVIFPIKAAISEH